MMRLNLMPWLAAGLLGTTPAWSGVECRVVCATPGGTCIDPTAAGMKAAPDQRVVRLTDCSLKELVLTEAASVWYARRRMLATKSLPKGARLASELADADAGCDGWRCIFHVPNARIPGANPMGGETQTEVDPGIMDAGLPYGEVAVTEQDLAIRVTAPSKGAEFVLFEDGPVPLGSFAATNSLVLVPARLLKPRTIYRYTWNSAAGVVNGRFTVAQPGTIRRAKEGAARSGDVDPETARLDMAAAMTSVGLRWNARQLLQAID
ncbi:MAG: hypothetical protein J0M20_09495 [Burkholderiales bacterium]|nr:hypothetical protein [Burkholderiales bacterium]